MSHLPIPSFIAISLFAVGCGSTQKATFDPRADTSISATIDPAFTSAGAAPGPSPELLRPPTVDYTVGPGDKLEIEILGEPDSRIETFVTPDSRLYFDLLPGIDVTGRSVTDLQQEMEQGLVEFYRQPQVAITLREAVSQRVAVLGRVNEPGMYPITRPLRVLDAISAAGGLFSSRFTGTTEELADLQHSFLIRDDQMLPVDFEKLLRQGDMKQNVYLKPGDLIYLPSALTNEVYVLGAVTAPRPIGFMNEMNLMSAIGRGLGLRPDADLTRVAIIRGSLTDPKIAIVDAQAVMQGKAPNFRLEPGDIIHVPGSGGHSLTDYTREAVNTFVRIVAANEGGNAGALNSQNVGVNVNIGGTN